MSKHTIILVAAIGLVPACGAQRQASSGGPIAEFPRPEALAAIAARPVPSPRIEEGAVPAQGWTVELAPPGEVAPADPASAPWQPRDDWDRAVSQALTSAGRTPRMSEAMACVAREMGEWTLGERKSPPAGLRRFIAGACGVTAPDFAMKALGGEVPTEAADDAIFERWGAQVPDLVAGLPADATDAGFAFVRQGGHAVALLAYVQAVADLEPFLLHPSESGEVSLAGTLRTPSDSVIGYVNRGSYGVAPCDVDPAIAPPRFRVTCKVDPGDERAWIELLSSPPRRMLASTFARVLARRPSTTQLDHGPADEGGAAATSPDEFAEAAVTALNEVRARAGLAPVRLHATESAIATHVAPYYFDAALGNQPPEQLDTIALGLLAGWEVQGMIRDGRFISTVVPQTRDPARWLADTLEVPMGRSALLADGIEQIAIGPVLLDDPEAAGAVVIGYRFHHGNDHVADVDRLHARTRLARLQRSLPQPTKLAGMDAVMRIELERVHLGTMEPRAALQQVMELASDRFGINVRGFVVEASSVESLQLPEELVNQRNLRYEIGVTHRKPEGAAWAQLVILVVFEDTGTVVDS